MYVQAPIACVVLGAAPLDADGDGCALGSCGGLESVISCWYRADLCCGFISVQWTAVS